MIPASSIDDTGLTALASNFAIMLILVGMGTMIHIKELMAQWKTVMVALVGLVGLALCSFTISSWLFDVSGRCALPLPSPEESSPDR